MGLQESSIQLSYSDATSPKPRAQSETRAEMFSTMREKAARLAAREGLASPALDPTLALALRASNVEIGFDRPGEPQGMQAACSESKQCYVKKPLPKLQSAAENLQRKVDLQNSNIDLAFGQDKSAKTWQTDLSEMFAFQADKKYGFEPPKPVDGSANYRTNVRLADDSHPYPSNFESVSKAQYKTPENVEHLKNYAATLGKELRQHSWDLGAVRTTSEWMPWQKAEMSRKQKEKFEVRKPAAFSHLKKELQKSSLFLGADDVDYESGEHRVISKAASVPGLVRVGCGACRY